MSRFEVLVILCVHVSWIFLYTHHHNKVLVQKTLHELCSPPPAPLSDYNDIDLKMGLLRLA